MKLALPAVVLTCVLFYWKLALSPEYVWFDHPDMCYIEIPRLQYQAREMHQGRFPLWDTNLWMGQPMLGQTQPGPVFPLNLLFLLLPMNNGYLDFRFLNWYFVVIHAIAAVGMYVLCRDLKRSQAASALAAFGFAFGGFVGSVAWLDVINGAIWTPLLCLFFLRAARGIRPLRNATLCGIVLAVAWLSGHHEIPMLVSWCLVAGWTWTVWRKGRAAVIPAALTFVISGLIAAVQLWPTAEYARLSRRWVGLENSVTWKDRISYAAPTFYSLPVKALPGIAVDDAGSHADSTLFLGIVLTALAVLAIAARPKHPVVRGAIVLAAASVVFALGSATPVHGLLFSFLPMLGKARVPVRGIHLLNFALALLAAYGLDTVLRRPTGVWVSRGLAVLGAFGGACLLAWLWNSQVRDGVVLAGFVALVLAGCLAAWRGGHLSRPAFVGTVLFLSLTELYPVATRTFALTDSKQLRALPQLTGLHDIAEFLRSEPAPRRIAINESDVPTNFGDWYGFDVAEGYVAGVSVNITDIPRHTPEMQNLLGITHYLGKQASRPDQQEVFTGATGIKVFRNAGALPRAWSVHQVEQIPTRGAVGDRIGQIDPRRTAFMTETAPTLDNCEGDDVHLLARGANRVRIRARMNCRGMVVLSETYFPGWQARVDGRELPIYEVFGALRGVVVERGDHELELHYKPMSVYGGAAITAAGLVLAAAILILADRHQPGRRKHLLPRRRG